MHSWLDPTDMGDGILTLRWAEFAVGRASDALSARSRVVPMARRRDELKDETRFVSESERAEILADRAKACPRQLPEAEAGESDAS